MGNNQLMYNFQHKPKYITNFTNVVYFDSVTKFFDKFFEVSKNSGTGTGTNGYDNFLTLDTETSPKSTNAGMIAKLDILQLAFQDVKTDIEYACVTNATASTMIELWQNYNRSRGMLVTYVHNLDYDYSFLRRWEYISNYAKLKEMSVNKKTNSVDFGEIIKVKRPGRKEYTKRVIKCRFKCSFQLTRASLKSSLKIFCGVDVADEKNYYDYSIAHTVQSLTNDELYYCIQDVIGLDRVMNAFHDMFDGGHTNRQHLYDLPTGTSYIRKLYADTLGTAHFNEQGMTREMLEIIEKTQSGGLTVCNSLHANRILQNVSVVDVNSMHPSRMVLKKYPTGRPILTHSNVLNEDIESVIWFGAVMLRNVKLRPNVSISCINAGRIDHFYQSKSIRNRCIRDVSGKIIATKGDSVITVNTNSIEFDNMKKLYTFDVKPVAPFVLYKADYLPASFRNIILNQHRAKSTSTGVVKEFTKLQLNSGYGVLATNPFKETEEYNEETNSYSKVGIDRDKVAKKYVANKAENPRVLPYAVGCLVASYSQQELVNFYMKYPTRENFVYADTDSWFVKDVNADFVANYNADIKTQLDALGLDYWSNDTETNFIGAWEIEKVCRTFCVKRPKLYVGYDEEGKLVKCANGGIVTKLFNDVFGDVSSLSHYQEKMWTIPGGKILTKRGCFYTLIYSTDYNCNEDSERVNGNDVLEYLTNVNYNVTEML